LIIFYFRSNFSCWKLWSTKTWWYRGHTSRPWTSSS